ncbi:MAG: IS1595 family transposase, partial [Thermofilum sp. ex4484_79]
MRLKGEVEVDEAYVPLGFKGQRRARPRRRGGGRRRGRCTGRKKPFFTLVERGSRKVLFLAEGDASCRTIATVLLRHVEPGSVVYTDGFRGYRRVSGLGYEHLPVRHSGGVYATGPVHVNGAESRNWHLRAF